MASTLRPFFGYYGGKWRDTPDYYPPPKYKRIVEPFAGSAGYSLRHGVDREVYLFEADPVLVSVWQFLINATPDDILSIGDVPEDGTVDDLDAPVAAKYLVGFWLNRGTSRPRKSPSAWMRQKIRPGCFWGERVRQTIASQVGLIKHWEIRAGGYESCRLTKEATWFVDPPYQKAGKHYRYGSEGIDYPELARWCKARKGQVIVCENDGAKWLAFRSLGHMKTTRKGKTSHEVYWLDTFGDNGAAQELAHEAPLLEYARAARSLSGAHPG
jgi:hypothetical protein